MQFFISGITGQVGGAAAHALLKEGHQLRALVRDPAKAASWAEKGAELRQGDFTDADTIARALEGVDGAFLMLPPQKADRDWPEAKAVCASYVRALSRSAPSRAVVLSSIGSEKSSGLGPITATHLLETALADVPCPIAFIRAGSFMENFQHALHQAAATGAFGTFFQPTSRPIPLIASEDIGKEVARRLTAPIWKGTKIIELGTPCSPDELAKVFGEILGRGVTVSSIPREGWSALIEKMGRGGTWAFEEMNDSYNSVWIAFGVAGTEAVPATITPKQFFTALKASR